MLIFYHFFASVRMLASKLTFLQDAASVINGMYRLLHPAG
jgi:hypothetical protein